MTFDKSKVYTALNADELKPGSKVILADSLENLKDRVEYHADETFVIKYIRGEDSTYRFVSSNVAFALAYLIEEPHFLYRCYLNQDKFDWYTDDTSITNHVYAEFFTEEEAEKWCARHNKFADVAKAWEEGKQIQFFSMYDGTWTDCSNNCPSWTIDYKYRVKPEPLHWNDIEVGDVINSGNCDELVTKKDYSDNHCHIYTHGWIIDDDLSKYTLVRRAKDV